MNHTSIMSNLSAKLNLLEDALQHRNKAVVLTEGQKAWAPSSSSDDLSCIPPKDKLNGAIRGWRVDGLLNRIRREGSIRQTPSWAKWFYPLVDIRLHSTNLKCFCIFFNVIIRGRNIFQGKNTEQEWNKSKEITGEQCSVWGYNGRGAKWREV